MSDWRALSTNPNDRRLYEERRQVLAAARGAAITDREAYIADQARGLRVLDVGVVDHEFKSALNPGSLHLRIKKVARECVGCDILADDVAELQKMGWNVVCHDITTSPLDLPPFDLIVCGEIIEHLDRPGNLFANCAAMLRAGGNLILSTPNPWYANCVLKNTFGGETFVENVDHTAWFDPCTLTELSSRYGFKLVRYIGVRVTTTYSLKARCFFALFSVLGALGLRRELFAKTILYEFEKQIG
jgi:2-polyprenyl-3-methyl-5-hydroxy-6-metoxy-1,4-benzoquinol methylase